MGALAKSTENFQTTFNPSGTGLHTNTVNLTKGQDETNCAAFVTLRHTNAAQNDTRISNAVGVEFFDNAGTPACRVHWNSGTDTSPGDLLVDVFVLEGGADLTIEQDTISLTSTSATATVSAVTLTKACVAHTQAGTGTSSGDDFNDFMLQMRFNSTTQIQVERRASGSPDWTVYAYTMSSSVWDTEYVEWSSFSADQGPINNTLSNSVTLANAFIIATYETQESSDDMRDGVWNHALTGTTTLTSYRNHGSVPAADATIGVWVVRATSSEFTVQRFATDVDGQLTTNQTITAVDLDKAIIIDSGNVGSHGWPINSNTTGSNVHDYQSTIVLTSTTNAQIQRQSDTAISGNNNNIRYEIVEWELEAAGAFVDMAIALSGVGDLNLIMTAEIGLATTLSGVGDLSADLNAAIPIAAALDGDAIIAADVNRVRNMVSVLTGEAVLAPNMGFATSLAVSLNADAVLLPKLNRVQAILISLSGEAVITATVGRVRAVASGLNGEAALGATLDPGTGFIDMTVALAGDADLGANLQRVRELNIGLQGEAEIAAVMSLIRAIAVEFSGVAVLSPNLTLADQVLGSYIPTFRPRRRP